MPEHRPDKTAFTVSGSSTLQVPDERLVGQAWINHLATGLGALSVRLVKAYFAPGARTVWHRHWAGQLVYVTDGTTVVRDEAGVTVRLHAGHAIACPPGVWHWHGALASGFTTQIAVIQVDEAGQDADWGAAVSDEEYLKACEEVRIDSI
jgi:quercetin dioxygenase-like cupin family protein